MTREAVRPSKRALWIAHGLMVAAVVAEFAIKNHDLAVALVAFSFLAYGYRWGGDDAWKQTRAAALTRQLEALQTSGEKEDGDGRR